MARALANECSTDDKRVAFYMRKGADCLSKWVGESERQLRLLFDQVRLKYFCHRIIVIQKYLGMYIKLIAEWMFLKLIKNNFLLKLIKIYTHSYLK